MSRTSQRTSRRDGNLSRKKLIASSFDEKDLAQFIVKKQISVSSSTLSDSAKLVRESLRFLVIRPSELKKFLLPLGCLPKFL